MMMMTMTTMVVVVVVVMTTMMMMTVISKLSGSRKAIHLRITSHINNVDNNYYNV